jgi:hypothetical protein
MPVLFLDCAALFLSSAALFLIAQLWVWVAQRFKRCDKFCRFLRL